MPQFELAVESGLDADGRNPAAPPHVTLARLQKHEVPRGRSRVALAELETAMKSGDGAKPVPSLSPRFRAAAFTHRHGREAAPHDLDGVIRSPYGFR